MNDPLNQSNINWLLAKLDETKSDRCYADICHGCPMRGERCYLGAGRYKYKRDELGRGKDMPTDRAHCDILLEKMWQRKLDLL